MFDFLRSIGLKPIEWSQAIQMTGETAPFVGDILDAAFLHAQAVVVLLTGDDEARLRSEYHTEKMPEYEKNLTPQSRPNVLFEAGLALGRFPKQTIIIEVGELRPFSDIAGRHTIRLNNSTKTRQDVAQRLAMAGCKVDLSGTDWHQTGNFDLRSTTSEKPRGKNFLTRINDQILSKLPRQTNQITSNDRDSAVTIIDDQITMMIIMSQYSGDQLGPDVSDLVSSLNMGVGKVIYLLTDLKNKGVIKRSWGGGAIANNHNFRLTEEGLRFLVENDLI
jgi:hypothetical protein